MKKYVGGALLRMVWLFGFLIINVDSNLASVLPADVLANLSSYNVTWPSASTNGSPGSMPLGNGDITANVWVENDGGDLMMYIGKSDSWSEATRLLKIGRTRMHFNPNPFAVGAPFSQTLDFYHGEVDIAAGQPGSQVSLRIWIDANQPVIRVEAAGQQNFTMSCSNEIWRSSVEPLNTGDSFSFYGVSSAPTTPSESADVAPSLADRLVWYHQNASSYLNTLFNAENMNGFASAYQDPWTNRIFGAAILATNFSVVNSQELQSGSGTNFLVSIYPYTAQTATAAAWQAQMSNVVAQVNATDLETARTNHYAWWDAFWNRSWIFVSGDTNAINVTRGYLEQRFMQACQSRGQYPIKFNGGTFTFDYDGQNGDYRAWGPSYWNQNTRLLYWPMLAAGDLDLMQPYFNIYTNMLPLQMAVTQKYFGHAGAFFPETFNLFGLYNGDNWGWDNSTGTLCGDSYITYHYQGGLDTLAMMLSYYDYTQDSSFATNDIVPFATQAIRFFNLHWPKVNGKLFFYPANACEMYWSCTNSTDYIAGLMSDINKLEALPANLTTPALTAEWSNCYASLPPLPMDPSNSYVIPAQTYGAAHNTENPECYSIFPYRLYGLGLTNLNIGLATFNKRTVQNYKSDWSQDVIEEALVGLTAAAQSDVILNFTDTDPTARFQAFWTSRNDYLPTEDTGGTAMSGLQYMLLQCNGSQIQPLPAWPSAWNVDFKLCAPSNTSVRLIFTNGTVAQLTVTPAVRTNDLVWAVPSVPTGLSANGGNLQVGLSWTASIGASSYNVKRSTNNGVTYSTIASGVTSSSYLDTSVLNGTNYYYVVSASNSWGESALSSPVGITPGTAFGAHVEGELIANLQSGDLASGSGIWTNRTASSNSVGNFTAVGGGNLNVANIGYGSGSIKAVYVNGVGNNAVRSAGLVPVEILTNSPYSLEAWVYATVIGNYYVAGYGVDGGSTNPHEAREMGYGMAPYQGFTGNYGPDVGWATTPTVGWHYLACTWDGSSVLLYQDGQPNGSGSGTLNTTQTLMWIGSSVLGGTPFAGYVASARVESGVLTAGDVAANYAAGPLAAISGIPRVPTGLTASAGNMQVGLSWTASVGAESYNVKRSTNNGVTYSTIATGITSPGYLDTGLLNGTDYYYEVSATNSDGESADSSPVSATPQSAFIARAEGDVIANLQSGDLVSGSAIWTNRTASSNSVGNFTAVGGGTLNVANIAYGSGSINAVYVNGVGNNAVRSAGLVPAEILTNSPYSLEAWVYATVIGNYYVAGYGIDGGSTNPHEAREMGYGTASYQGFTGNYGPDVGWATTPTVGWHYLACTWDGSSVQLYQDGQPNGSGNGTLNTPQTLMWIGSSALGGTPFAGYVASARVESGVLSAGDVAANYAAGPLATILAIPTVPTGLTASAGNNQVGLSWTASVDADSYNVERSTNNGITYSTIATGITSPSYLDTGLLNGSNYYYVVSAKNLAGESPNSIPISAQPVSTTPPQFGFGANNGQIQISWPQDHTGWHLQIQTNSLGSGLGTNWVTLPGSAVTNQMTFTVDPTEGVAFFRLVYP